MRDRIAWHILNLGARIATPWYRGFIIGSVFYGMDKAAKEAGYAGCPITPPERYRKEVIRALLRDGEQFIEEENT